MICSKCGSEILEGASFCTECGEPVAGAGLSAAEQAARALSQRAASRPSAQASSSRKVSFAVAAVAVVAALGLLLLASGSGGLGSTSAQAAAYEVAVSLAAEGLGPGSTNVPLAVQGKTAAGEPYSQTAYVSPVQPVLRLPLGVFEVSLAGSPISSEGGLFRATSDEPAVVELQSDGSGGARLEGAAPGIGLEPIPDSEVTAEMVEAAVALARLDPAPSPDVNLAELAARATERAGRAGEGHVEAWPFSFDLPEYWVGKVEWTIETSRHSGLPYLIIRPKGMGEELLRIYVKNLSEEMVGGDIATHNLGSVTLEGFRVELWHDCWVVMASKGYGGLSDAELMTLIDLSSLGMVQFDEIPYEPLYAHAGEAVYEEYRQRGGAFHQETFDTITNSLELYKETESSAPSSGGLDDDAKAAVATEFAFEYYDVYRGDPNDFSSQVAQPYEEDLMKLIAPDSEYYYSMRESLSIVGPGAAFITDQVELVGANGDTFTVKVYGYGGQDTPLRPFVSTLEIRVNDEGKVTDCRTVSFEG